MRLAVALPSLEPGAAHRVAFDQVLEALGTDGVEIECFAESTRLREGAEAFPAFHYLRMRERHLAAPFDTALYALGRDYRPYEPAFLLAKQFPGMVWVLDPVLHHLVVGGMAIRGRWDAYRRVSEQAFGATASGRIVDALAAGWTSPAFYRRYDPVPALLRGQRRLLTATEAIRQTWPGDGVSGVVDLPLGLDPTGPDRTESGADLTVVSMNFNRPQPLLRALRGVLSQSPGLRIELFAPELTHEHLLAPAARRIGGLEKLRWRLTTDWTTLRRQVERAGMVAFLREDLTVGERALLHQALAAGKHVVTLRTHHYDPYPEGATIKIAPGTDLSAHLAASVALLQEEPALRSALSDAARRFASDLPGATAVASELREHLEASTSTPADWADLAAPARDDLAGRLRRCLIPSGSCEASRRVVGERLKAVLGVRWWGVGEGPRSG